MASFPRRGEIYLVRMVGEQKQRPVVVVSINSRNERANDILIVPITTNPRPGPTHVHLLTGEAGLDHDSVARCEHITVIPKAWLSGPSIGPPLPATKQVEIQQAIQRAIGVIVP